MARRKEPNKQQVNRVPRKADEQELLMGGHSKLPEDEVKRHRKKHTEIKTGSGKKPSQIEIDEARKGRASAKEKVKEYKDSHVPRKTELEKQYTKELQKLRNRLNYREKQGFVVDWESLPSRQKNITQHDIDLLKGYEIELNEFNEITLKQTRVDKEARQDKLRLPSELLPSNLFPTNEEGYVEQPPTTGELNIAEWIDTQLWEYSLRVSAGEDPSDFLQGKTELIWSILEEKVQAYNDARDLLRQVRQRYPEALLDRYYYQRKDEILSWIIEIYRASRVEWVIECKAKLLRYIEPH